MTPNSSLAEQSPPAVWPSRLVAWWGCFVLTFGCILGFADRGIVNLFVIPIQRDLHLTDTQVSLVTGTAFALFNALFGLPAGRWIDGSGWRTRITALGIAAWSLATAAGGLATTFWQLFAARVAVGIGEATVTPSGVSLLADLFPPNRRGLPVGIFYGGLFVGSGGALIVGGALWHALGDHIIRVPLLGSHASWQVILMIAAIAGLVVAPLTLTVGEPPRMEGLNKGEPGGAPVREVLRFYRAHARALVGHNLGFGLYNFVLLAGSAWLPTMLVRNYDWSLAKAGTTFGGMLLVLGPTGSAVAGMLADALCRRGRADGKLLVAIGAALALFALTVAFAVPLSPAALLATLAGFAFIGCFSLPLAAGALQEVMPNAMRGQAIALYVAATNIIGGSFAGTAVALITDHIFHDRLRLNLAFSIVGTVASGLAVLTLFTTLRSYRETVAKALAST